MIKIKPISWQICKFLHFSVPRHIHNKRLLWQHLRLMRIVVMCKMTPISVRLSLKNFILISCAVLELLRKVSQGGRNPPPPPGEIGLSIEIEMKITANIEEEINRAEFEERNIANGRNVVRRAKSTGVTKQLIKYK